MRVGCRGGRVPGDTTGDRELHDKQTKLSLLKEPTHGDN